MLDKQNFLFSHTKVSGTGHSRNASLKKANPINKVSFSKGNARKHARAHTPAGFAHGPHSEIIIETALVSPYAREDQGMPRAHPPCARNIVGAVRHWQRPGPEARKRARLARVVLIPYGK